MWDDPSIKSFTANENDEQFRKLLSSNHIRHAIFIKPFHFNFHIPFGLAVHWMVAFAFANKYYGSHRIESNLYLHLKRGISSLILSDEMSWLLWVLTHRASCFAFISLFLWKPLQFFMGAKVPLRLWKRINCRPITYFVHHVRQMEAGHCIQCVEYLLCLQQPKQNGKTRKIVEPLKLYRKTK